MISIALCFLVGFSVGRILGCSAARKQFYRPLVHDHCAVCQSRLIEAFGRQIPDNHPALQELRTAAAGHSPFCPHAQAHAVPACEPSGLMVG